jgi:protein-disulfide isomerase
MRRLLAVVVVFLLAAGLSAGAQSSVPPNTGDRFKDTSLLKPPPGARVAIFEFEDMECPLCAHVSPIVHAAVDHYKIPFVRHDYPLTEIHIWSFNAAVTARYLQDTVSPKIAEDYRRDVFASQSSIASREDLANFTQRWFQSHGQKMPFVMGASGHCTQEVKADRALGDQIGVHRTPCLFVVTQKGWTQVVDINQLYSTIDIALAETSNPAKGTSRNIPRRY